MKAYFRSKILQFKRPSGTSRGVLQEKPTWYIILENDGIKGVGECSPLKGLSIDDPENYENKLVEVCDRIEFYLANLHGELLEWPSIRFGLEMAKLDIEIERENILFPSDFTDSGAGIPINGLIWMGDKTYMNSQIKSLLGRGFECLKMKIGAINFEDEIEILGQIRREFPTSDLTIRVDANGAFGKDEALEKLKKLSDFQLHSIEQPIKAGQWEMMAELCDKSPLDIALDEELISVIDLQDQASLLEQVKPQYIILKPSLVGGFKVSEEWIKIAEGRKVGWWITSALESNIGLNAIAQWTYHLGAVGFQGLGTGSLYLNNIESPLAVKRQNLYYDLSKSWSLHELF